ncbi:restriction endonuclease subunit S [Xenorhabdus sp. SF857]|uniref:restriction endonuclease subunit S n=1 Tax=Xenorhabdus bakwenae TaxID=3026967 RepID=UPI0025581BA6|nr:restriction endonuclease subunit S [Xenorhabdus sp. SF857]WFQ80856.1 restriction endonuclease subunit S [Xenorhabdus sp. SF857]
MNKKKYMVPELRFPEFKDDPHWPCVELNEVAKRSKNKNKGENVSRVLTNSAVDGVVDQRDYFDKDIAVKGNLETYYVVDKGDYVYNPRISTVAPVGPISKNKVGKGVMSPLYTVFRFNSKNNEFFEHFFKSSRWHGYLRTVSNNGARHDRMSITSSEFMAMPVPYPGEVEQQKIADCLASIDELITLHAQKLDILKSYKKGLMQQLFPAEGENVPKLRFPEFRSNQEWIKVTLGQLGELVSGLTYSPTDVCEEGLLVLRSSNVQNGQISLGDNVFVRPDVKGANLSKPGDILICVRNGSKALIGKNALIPENLPRCTHGAFMTIFRTNRSFFIYQLFQTYAYDRQVAADLGATINSINGNQLKKYDFHIPKSEEEQDKIASFLSSIDQMISSQIMKVNELKNHKQGLIQKLFPVMDDVI